MKASNKPTFLVIPPHSRAKYSQYRPRPNAQATGVLSWQDAAQSTKDANQHDSETIKSRPSSRVLETSEDSVWSAGIDENHPVLLIRDSDAWCPYCQRVWLALEWKGIDYDTMLISLRNKPKWYLDLVPRGLVPVAKVKDKLVTESYDILKALEEHFPQPALLPAGSRQREDVLKVCEQCSELENSGYALMAEDRPKDDGSISAEASPSGRGALSKLEEQLDKLETLLREHGGPYIMGKDLTLADVMYVPSLERFAAQLPTFKGFNVRDNASYPTLSRWYKAMDELPSYQKVRSDDRTTQLKMRKLVKMENQHIPKLNARTQQARLEAATHLGQNHGRIIDDILENSGLVRVRSSQYGGTLRALNGYPSAAGPALIDAVDHALRRVCHFLLKGTPGQRHECLEACAIGSAALVFFRNRISAPRDVSAAAGSELRHACSEILLDMF